jgi:hypothetical protein
MAILFADGFEDAFIGIGERNGIQFATYDYAKCVRILVERDGMSEDDAEEFIEYNVLGARSSEKDQKYLPSFLTGMTFDEYKKINEEVDNKNN